MVDLQGYVILAVSFLFVAIFSILLEKVFNLVNIDQKRPTSPFHRGRENRHLMPFIGRSLAIFLRYVEIFILAGLGLFLDWSIRQGLTKSSHFIIPMVIMFIPTSFWIVTLCVPKQSREFFSPYLYEWVISGLLFVGGLVLLILMLQPS